MAGKTIAERNVAAECRAVEAGHRAFVMEGGWVKVVSDTFDGKWYEVQFVAHCGSGLISFVCVPRGRKAYNEDHFHTASAREGELPCMHAATAVRRLERARLARLDDHGRWAAAGHLLVDAEDRRRLVDAKEEAKDPWEGIEGATR